MGVTIKDIAKICGVGVSTVSRAVNGHPDINEETRKRIMQAIREHGFVPNNSARNLKISDSRTIALMIKGISNPFFSKMIKVFEEETKERGYSLVVQHVREHTDEVDEALKLLTEKRLKGIIFLGGYLNHVRERLDRISVPFVLSTISIEGQEISKLYNQVSVDDMREAERAVTYLIERGHRDIAILTAGETDHSVGKLRLRGYGAALKAHGIKIKPELIVATELSEEVYTFENGYRTTEKLLLSGAKFTALFAIADTLALGAMRALYDHGLRVPEDISVIGFDGLDMAAYSIPALTTLRQPTDEIAKETVETLFREIEEQDSEKRQIIFEGVIQEGGSVRRIETEA